MKYRIQTLLASLLVTVLAVSQPAEAKRLEFSLVDSFGRKVTSQDYVGVPIFLEFGACW